MACSVSACPRLSFALSANVCTMCMRATAASPERRRLSASTTSKASASDLIDKGVYDLLKMYFVMTVEVDANGPYVKVMTNHLSYKYRFCVCVCVCVCVSKYKLVKSENGG